MRKFKVGDVVRHKTVAQATEGVITDIADDDGHCKIEWLSWTDEFGKNPVIAVDPPNQLILLSAKIETIVI